MLHFIPFHSHEVQFRAEFFETHLSRTILAKHVEEEPAEEINLLGEGQFTCNSLSLRLILTVAAEEEKRDAERQKMFDGGELDRSPAQFPKKGVVMYDQC